MRTDTHRSDHRSDHRYDHGYDRRPARRPNRFEPASIWPQPNMPEANPEIYWGWSPQNQRMEMMDLPRFVEAYLSGYQQAMDQLRSATPSADPRSWSPEAWAAEPSPRGRHHHHDHGARDHHHHEHCGCRCGHHDHDHHGHDHDHHGHGCGCDGHDHHHDHSGHGCGCDDHDCHCECCISGDADIVVYARCGEVRVLPIEIENDTRRDRQDVTFAVSEVRTAGGRQLPWKVRLDPADPQTLRACSKTVIDLLVGVQCETADTGGDDPDAQPATTSSRTKKAAAKEAAAEEERTDESRRADVDECEVGYVTVRAEGCLIRPIVVAVAVVPRGCDAYHAGCSCTCCC